MFDLWRKDLPQQLNVCIWPGSSQCLCSALLVRQLSTLLNATLIACCLRPNNLLLESGHLKKTPEGNYYKFLLSDFPSGTVSLLTLPPVPNLSSWCMRPPTFPLQSNLGHKLQVFVSQNDGREVSTLQYRYLVSAAKTLTPVL